MNEPSDGAASMISRDLVPCVGSHISPVPLPSVLTCCELLALGEQFKTINLPVNRDFGGREDPRGLFFSNPSCDFK